MAVLDPPCCIVGATVDSRLVLRQRLVELVRHVSSERRRLRLLGALRTAVLLREESHAPVDHANEIERIRDGAAIRSILNHIFAVAQRALSEILPLRLRACALGDVGQIYASHPAGFRIVRVRRNSRVVGIEEGIANRSLPGRNSGLRAGGGEQAENEDKQNSTHWKKIG